MDLRTDITEVTIWNVTNNTHYTNGDEVIINSETLSVINKQFKHF